MGLFDSFIGPDINRGVDEWKETPGSVLLDVRTADEYRQGHIPGSMNIELDDLRSIPDRIPGKDTPLFVHCLSGARSDRAVQALRQMGYTRVKNIGGINRYRGKVEAGK